MFRSDDHEFFFSSVSIWEIDIKNSALTADGRSRLPLKTDLSNMIGFFLEKGLQPLDLKIDHIATTLDAKIDHRDPFDWILLKQCQAEGFLLLTSDRLLARHPLVLPV